MLVSAPRRKFMKTLRTTLVAGAVSLLSFVGCSHNNTTSDRGTTPAPALETSSQSAAPATTPATVQTGTTTPISAPVNDPSIQSEPTGSGVGQPTPSGGLPPTTAPRNDDTLGSPSTQDLNDSSATSPSGTATDDTTPPSAQPEAGKLDAGVPPTGKAPSRDAGTGTNNKMDAGTKMNPR
jgi:hypothetical protein